MENTNLSAIESRLFSHPILSHDEFVIEQDVPLMADKYHQTIFQCPKPLAFVRNTLGISKEQIKEHQIGFADGSLYEDLPPRKTVEREILNGSLKRLALQTVKGHELMKGCITLPIREADGIVAMFGLRHDRPRRDATFMKYSNFGVTPIYALQGLGKVAFRCNNPLDVIALDGHGYHNGFAELEGQLSEVSCDMLCQLGVSVLVYFSDAMGANFDVDEARYIAERYDIKLCEVNLPFQVINVGKWDDFQWKLFDTRITRALAEIGVRNERHQA
jgi:hypothetical protein